MGKKIIPLERIHDEDSEYIIVSLISSTNRHKLREKDESFQRERERERKRANDEDDNEYDEGLVMVRVFFLYLFNILLKSLIK